MKPPHVDGVAFSWHRDGQYETWKTLKSAAVDSSRVALDDVSEENGTLRLEKRKERFGPDFDVASIRDEDDDIIATMNAEVDCIFHERCFTREWKEHVR